MIVGRRGKVSDESKRTGSSNRLTVVIVTLLGLTVAYVASLAPAWRFAGTSRRAPLGGFYEPVLLLMEETPLRVPLLGWCAIWGVHREVEGHLTRRALRGSMDIPDLL